MTTKRKGIIRKDFLGLIARGSAGVALGNLFSSCGITEPDTKPPKIEEHFPDKDANNIDIEDLIVKVYFNEPLDYESVVNGFSLKEYSTGNNISGTASYDDNTYIASFTPAENIKPGELYTATLKDVKDEAGNSMTYSWSFKTKYMVGIDEIICNDTDEAIENAKVWINGKEVNAEDGKFIAYVNENQDVVIEARGYDNEGNAKTYKRTETLKAENNLENLNVNVVSYPTQEGVSPELFKDFCEEANFRMGANGFDYRGLKTMFGNPNAQYWISSHGDSATYSEGGVATADEQTYVRNLIENVIYPHLREENRVPIYVEDPDSVENIPLKDNGHIVVVPRNHPSFGIGVADDDHDGIADWAVIYLPNGQWDETHRYQILEESLSALVGINDVNNPELNGKTALNLGGNIFQIDEKLIKICEYYQPKEQINNILGM